MAKEIKVLIYRLGRLGDTIVALPALKAIRENFPKASVTLLYNKFEYGVSPEDLLINTNLIDSYIFYSREKGIYEFYRLWRRIRKNAFDILIYLPPGRRTFLAVFRDKIFWHSTGIPKLLGLCIGVSRGSEQKTITETENLLNILRDSGLIIDESQTLTDLLVVKDSDKIFCEKLLNINIPFSQRGAMVAFGIGSNMPAKRWSKDKFLELGKQMIQRLGITPVIIGGKEDYPLGEELVNCWGKGLNAAGKLSIVQSYHLLSLCGLYVGNDTGVMHLAALAGVRCVALFSARDTDGRWFPGGKGHIIFRKKVPCEGCMLNECPQGTDNCMDKILNPEVFEQCQYVLRQISETAGK